MLGYIYLERKGRKSERKEEGRKERKKSGNLCFDIYIPREERQKQ